jgi:hypothetical protein
MKTLSGALSLGFIFWFGTYACAGNSTSGGSGGTGGSQAAGASGTSTHQGGGTSLGGATDTLGGSANTSEPSAGRAAGGAGNSGGDVLNVAGESGAGDAGTSASAGTAQGGDAGSAQGGNAGGDISVNDHALRLDGIDDYLQIPGATGGANEAAFSSEVWFNTNARTGMLLEVYSTAKTGADRSLYLSAGRVCFYVFAPSYSELCTSAANFDDGAWHHAAGTLGASGQFLYVDGKPERSEPTVTSSAFDFDTGFRAGYGYIGPNGPLTYFAGELDELRVWSVQRSALDILANFKRSIEPTSAGLQGYWKLDGSLDAATAIDSTSGAHDGTLTNFSFSNSPWVSPGAF